MSGRPRQAMALLRLPKAMSGPTRKLEAPVSPLCSLLERQLEKKKPVGLVKLLPLDMTLPIMLALQTYD